MNHIHQSVVLLVLLTQVLAYPLYTIAITQLTLLVTDNAFDDAGEVFKGGP